MKKVSAVVVLMSVVVCCVFAAENSSAFDFAINDNLSIKFISIDPVYKPYIADSWSVATRAQYIKLLNDNYVHQTLAFTRAEEGNEDQYYKYETVKPEQKEDFVFEVASFRDKADAIKQLYRVKTGFSFSALRFTFKDIAALELNVQGALNLVFDAENGTDCLGFDGIYFYGINGSILDDLISFRIGKHHYSGHYGDEIQESFMLRKDNQGRMYADRFSYDRSQPGYISRLIQYVRQDSLVIGLSGQPFPWVRLYGELDVIPGKILRIRPWVLVPEGVYCADSNDKETLEQSIGKSEGLYPADGNQSRKVAYPSSYKDMSVETGVEFTLPVKDILDVQIGFDFKFFQEAETGYQVGAFDKNNKWDVDYNILLGINMKNTPVSAELIYHKGRFPLMNFFWYQCSYLSAGISITY